VSLLSDIKEDNGKIADKIIRRCNPFIDSNITLLYKYVIKLHQNNGDIWWL